MPKTNKKTKLTAVAAALAMVASSGYAVSLSQQSARAEEVASVDNNDNEQVQAQADTPSKADDINSAISWITEVANSDSAGYCYDSSHRMSIANFDGTTPVATDCSGLVWHAWKIGAGQKGGNTSLYDKMDEIEKSLTTGASGESLPDGRAPYSFEIHTQDYYQQLGFTKHAYNQDELVAGDIIWKYDTEAHSGHVALYIGNGMIAHAVETENHTGICDTLGDQLQTSASNDTEGEIRISPVDSVAWTAANLNGYLRYEPTQTPEEPEEPVITSAELREAPELVMPLNAQAQPGDTVTITMRQADAQKSGSTDSLSKFNMVMSAPPSDLTVKEVRVKEGANLIYSSTRENMSDNRGSYTRDSSGNYVFEFYPEYLEGKSKELSDGTTQGGMGYSGTVYTMELVVEIPSSDTVLDKYVDADTGNAVFGLGGMKAWSVTSRAGAPESTTSQATLAADASNITVPIKRPSLDAKLTTNKKDTGAQIFDTVTYDLTIINNGNGPAKGVTIKDEQIDKYAGIGIVPVVASVTKGGVAIKLPSTSMTINNGNIEISLPPTMQIMPNERLVVTYTLTAGVEGMKENKGELQKLLEMDAENRSGERRVTVDASNLKDGPIVAEACFNLLIPSASVTASVSKNEVTTGERVQVTSTFRAEGEDGSVIQNPRINISNPAFGRIENIKVDGVPYNRGDVLRDLKKGDSHILTYDIVAPSDYSPDYAKGISTTPQMTADNLVSTIAPPSNNPAQNITVSIPELGIGVEVSDKTPSAEDKTDAAHPVHVTAVVNEKSGNSAASGIQLIISDIPSAEGKNPVADKFENVRVNGEELAAGTYQIDETSGVMTINIASIAKGGDVKVEYDNYLVSGYEANGYAGSVSARIQKASAASSNFPTGQEKNAVTDYTIQTPELHISQEITDPVSESTEGEGDAAVTTTTPDVINVGDTVKFRTTFHELNEEMPNAKGRDFVLTEKIEDLFISNEKPTDKENNTKTERESDERDSATKAEDIKKDGHTYKASQLGITFADDVKLFTGEGEDAQDVTDKYDVKIDSSKGELTVTPKADGSQDMTEVPTSMEFAVKMGKYEDENNYDQLPGKDIKVTGTVAVSNLSRAATAVSTTKIADAELYLTKSAADKEISHGMTDTYTITAVNDKDNKFDDNSVARNIAIEDDLDAAAAALGYKIDPATLKVMMGDEDITSTSDVYVFFDKDNTGFDLKLSKDLDKEKTLTITYDATTTSIAADAYTESLGNVVIASADNAKPAVAFENVTYAGVDFPVDGANVSGEDALAGSGEGSIAGTGDIVPYVIGGVIAVALIGGVIVLVVRKRRQ